MLQPAWWQLWWVQLAAVLLTSALLAAMIVSGFRARLRLSKRRNRLLEQEVAARTTELSALLAVSQSITAERNLGPLLVRVLDNVGRAIPHAGSVVLLRAAASHMEDSEVQVYRIVDGSSALAKSQMTVAAFDLLAPTVTSGALLEPGSANGKTEQAGGRSAAQVLATLAPPQEAVNGWIGVPLTEHGRVVGLLLLYAGAAQSFDEEDLPSLQRFANQLAIAIENARLYAQSQQLAIDVERGRLSRELHDSVTQLLYSISLHANAAERALALGRPAHGAQNMREARQLAQEALHELRTLIFELRLTPLEGGGLVAALQAYLDTVVARSGPAVRLEAACPQRYPQTIEFELYRIAQEALTNVVKHANATAVTVRVYGGSPNEGSEKEGGRDGSGLTLAISDNGAGFDLPAAQARGTIGLHSMAERAEKIGARLTIVSRPGRGTTVKVEL